MTTTTTTTAAQELSDVVTEETARVARVKAQVIADLGISTATEGLAWSVNRLAAQRAKLAALQDAQERIADRTKEGMDADLAFLRVFVSSAGRLAQRGAATTFQTDVEVAELQGRLAALETLSELLREGLVMSRITVA